MLIGCAAIAYYSFVHYPKTASRSVTGGWKIYRMLISEKDYLSELPSRKEVRFSPNSYWSFGVPAMDLQPLAAQEKSEAYFQWKAFGKDSVELIDNRYGVISGKMRVFLFDDRRPYTMVLTNDTDTIILQKQHMFLNPKVEIYTD